MDEVFRALADPGRRALLDASHARDGQSLRELGEGLVMTRQIRRYDQARAQTLADLEQALQESAEETAMSDEFVYVTYIRTTPEKLWQALTDPAFTTRYFEGGGPRSDCQVGSPVYWSMSGEPHHDWDQRVLEADPPRRLSYSWHSYQPEMQGMSGWSDARLAELQQERRSKVTFDIEPAGQAVKLTVTHDGFVPDSEMLRGGLAGLAGILSNLKSVLETGEVTGIES